MVGIYYGMLEVASTKEKKNRRKTLCTNIYLGSALLDDNRLQISHEVGPARIQPTRSIYKI